MAIVKQGGAQSIPGQVMTTMGYRARRAPLCMKCGLRKEDGLMTINANGQEVCVDCASPKDRVVLTGCDPENCACGSDEAESDRPA